MPPSFVLALTVACVSAGPASLTAADQAPAIGEKPTSLNVSVPKTEVSPAPTSPPTDRGSRSDRREKAEPSPEVAARVTNIAQSLESELRSLLATATAASGKLSDSERTQLEEIGQKLSLPAADVPALLTQASSVFGRAAQRERVEGPPETRPSDPSSAHVSLEKSQGGPSTFAVSLIALLISLASLALVPWWTRRYLQKAGFLSARR